MSRYLRRSGLALVVALGFGCVGCGGGGGDTSGNGGTTTESISQAQANAVGDLASDAIAESPDDDDLDQALDDVLSEAGDSDLAGNDNPVSKARQSVPTLSDLGWTMPVLPKHGLTFSGNYQKTGTLYDPTTFNASGTMNVTSAGGTNLTVQATAGSGQVNLKIDNGTVVTQKATYGVNANVLLTTELQEQAIEQMLKNAGEESPADAELAQTLEDLESIAGDADTVGSSRAAVTPTSLPVTQHGVTFSGSYTKSGTLMDPSTFSASGTITATSAKGTNLTLNAAAAGGGGIRLQVVDGTIVTSSATYKVNWDITIAATGTTKVVTITKNNQTVFEENLTHTATGVVTARAHTLNGSVKVWDPTVIARASDKPEWLNVTFTNLTFNVTLASGNVTMSSGAALVEVGDTPSGSANLSVSGGSLNGQLTLNGQPAGTLIIQPPLVVLVPGDSVGGGASCTRQVTVTRDAVKFYETNVTTIATGVAGTRAYTRNGTVYVARFVPTGSTAEYPQWVKTTYTNLVYQVNLLTKSASFVSGKVKVEAGIDPALSGEMSVASGSLSGTLQKNGQTVATIKVVSGLIIVVPTTT